MHSTLLLLVVAVLLASTVMVATHAETLEWCQANCCSCVSCLPCIGSANPGCSVCSGCTSCIPCASMFGSITCAPQPTPTQPPGGCRYLLSMLPASNAWCTVRPYCTETSAGYDFGLFATCCVMGHCSSGSSYCVASKTNVRCCSDTNECTDYPVPAGVFTTTTPSPNPGSGNKPAGVSKATLDQRIAATGKSSDPANRYDHSEALAALNANGDKFRTNRANTGRDQASSTSLDGMKRPLAAKISTFFSGFSGEQIIVTGGTEVGYPTTKTSSGYQYYHAPTSRHYNGEALDLRKTAALDAYIRKNGKLGPTPKGRMVPTLSSGAVDWSKIKKKTFLVSATYYRDGVAYMEEALYDPTTRTVSSYHWHVEYGTMPVTSVTTSKPKDVTVIVQRVVRVRCSTYDVLDCWNWVTACGYEGKIMNAQQVFSCDWSAGGCRTVGWETKCTDGSRYYTPNANAPPRPGKYNVQDHINKNDAWLSPSSTRPDSSSSRRDALFNETWNCSATMVVAEVPTAANVTAQSSDSDVAEGEEVLEDNGGGASDADYSITTRMIVVNNTCASIFPMSSVEVATSWGTTASDNTTATNFSAANNDTLSFSEGTTTQRSVAAALPVCSFLMAGGVLLFLLLI